MRIFGLEIKRAPNIVGGVDSRGSHWWPRIHEHYSGAWQNNDSLCAEDALSYFAVYSCITLISSDIGKLRPKLLEQGANDIWREIDSPSFSPVLRKPNRYQNHIQFKEWWIMSKLTRGNTYVLKQRDERGVVVALYVLDPSRVQVLVATDGSVYYQLGSDNLNDLEESVVAPASEIIHDRMNCLYHPLVGISPLYASAMAALQGLTMQKDAHSFFRNGARPSGILSAPGSISEPTAERMKAHWETEYSGRNAGRVAVLGDDVKFLPMRSTAVDAQFLEQMEWLPEQVCSTFHVPPFKIGLGDIPAGQKIEDLNQIYYTDCLQTLIENMELCLDEGLKLPARRGIELDLKALLRMDTATHYKVLGEGVKGSLLAPNEARSEINMPPLEGGDTIWMQQQDWPMEVLATRRNPPATATSNTAPVVVESEPESEPDENTASKLLALCLHKELNFDEN